MPTLSPKNVHKTFELGMTLKGLDGILELIGGALFLLLKRTTINKILFFLTQRELAQDPNDWIANTLLQAGRQLTNDTKLFGALYLLTHGVAKVVLVAALLRGKLWSYPASIAVLLLFIAYQVYHVIHRPSVAMVLLTLFDAAVIWLVWLEYQNQKA